jgi:hypothetical protein
MAYIVVVFLTGPKDLLTVSKKKEIISILVLASSNELKKR